MNLTILKPRAALNKAFLKVKPNRSVIETFKRNLISLIDQINEAETEEFHKNIISNFLSNTYYALQHYINTRERKDLVIHNGKDAKSTVGVIIEAKRPTNKAEMLRKDNINAKALQELVLYYLRERISHKNLEIKHLIVSNIYEWFVFDAQLFEKVFAQDNALLKQFTDFEEGRLAGKSTDFFYKEIAKPAIEKVKNELIFTHFDIRDYEIIVRNNDQEDDNQLIALYKLLSPEHLLKLPFANDSNSLDKTFYAELLHIIGLTETKEGSKKLIERKKPTERNPGSLLENTISQLDSLDKISRLEKPNQFGENQQERLFNVGLELVITWINRILFLKLLEAQLLTYHKGNPAYTFLNLAKIQGFDDLSSLFFGVLARKPAERESDLKKLFEKVPYLNSSLFEPTEIEHNTLLISNLRDDKKLPILGATVLRDNTGKRKTGDFKALEYLFEFLNAYDFASEGSEEIQEDNKTLINASVLGLIFEKINGYKDGSFFTPGFITMYMCRETIRRAVVAKFQTRPKFAKVKDFEDLYDRIDDRKEANQIINSLKICDPAVGSGHFLVSALNEMIAIKSELKILQDRQGRRLKEYQVEVVNDELIVTDEESDLFEYNPSNPESQRIQETLFHEKHTIIENCLFGVDINPNSVKICRLRLWIELLKNAYYKSETGYTELETLPNIDINIKCGNSLISRFALDTDLKQALKKSKWTIDTYKIAVQTYHNTTDKTQKRDIERLIADIKSDFRSEISKNDPKIKKLNAKGGELYTLVSQTQLFAESEKDKKERLKKQAQLEKDIEQLTAEIAEIKSNKIFENSFEWRFEFPEVLNDEGDFVGFDVVIGNPPYIRQEEIKEFKPQFKSQFKLYTGTADIYIFFIEKGFDILKANGVFTFIMPNKFMQAGYGQPARKFLLEQNLIEIIDFGDFQVFEEATTYPCVLTASKEPTKGTFKTTKINSPDFITDFPAYVSNVTNPINHNSLNDETWVVSNSQDQRLLQKVISKGEKLDTYIVSGAKRGLLTGLTEAFVISSELRDKLIAENKNSQKLIKPFLLGRNIKSYEGNINTNWLILVPKGFTIKRNLPPNSPYYVSEPTPRYGNMEYDDAWLWFSKNYPAIANHLLQFKSKAELRTDKGDYWWELRACDYYDKFANPKIMYQKFQVKPCFIYDEGGLLCNDSMWFIPSDDKVLLGILNSKMGWWLISKYCTAIQNGFQLIWKYFSQIPIPNASDERKIPIKVLVNQILDLKKQNPTTNTHNLETQIDQLVYALYDLTEEEIKLVEGV